MFALMGLFPPWEQTYGFRYRPAYVWSPAGYAPIFLPPQPDTEGGIRLDFGRLAVQWALVSAITASIMATQRHS